MQAVINRRDFCNAMLAAGAWTTSKAAAGADNETAMVLVEAEAFDNPGGWVVDQQSVPPMGSSYLLAHGFGVPVADAVTQVRFPEPGRYHVFVRTRDWTGPWKTGDTSATVKAKGSPGVFEALVDSRPLPVKFGAESAAWHWQSGGEIEISSRTAEIRLRDLTGFDARCEAIVFSKSPDFKPPESRDEMRAWRASLHGFPAEPALAGEFDLLVAGGGVAGICASIAAARSGLKVALIHDRPVLGGNSSSEIRVSPNSVRNVPPFPNLGNVVKEFDWNRPAEYNDDGTFELGDKLRLLIVKAETNISLYLNHHVCAVRKSGDTIVSADAAETHSGRLHRFQAKLFADCTGDATLGYLAGADFRMGRESMGESGESRAPETSDDQVLGSTLHWYTRETPDPSPFPDCPWALKFTEESCLHAIQGAWNWETGYLRNQACETELIRDHMLRAIYGNWSFQKNHSASRERYANRELAWVAYVLGKRESRRLMGDVIYSQHDLEKGTSYPDACIACDWGIDIHVPDPDNERHFPGWPFMAVHQHYDKGKAPMRWLPYRSLYSRNIANLFMAGRNVSCTHVGLAWFRCQRTTGMMGEVAGLAASLCAKRSATPRGLYQNHLDDLIHTLRQGVPPRQA